MPSAPRSTIASGDPCRADLQSRLVNCFAAAFANLAPEETPRATVSSLAGWDSLASMTLVALVEEEFNLRIPASDLASLTSFSSILKYLNEHIYN
jgi:acyl carrier protein